MATRRSQVLSLMAALGLAASAAFAAPTGPGGAASLREVVKPGDLIAVTRWSGGKVKGQVVGATDCSVTVRADGRSLRIEHDAIKTLRRYAPPKQNGKAMLDAVERCDRIECTPGTLAVVGLAAVFKGIRDVGRRPQVVYRAADRADVRAKPSAPACSPAR